MATKEKLDTSKAPLLPYSPVQYDRTYGDTLNNILRQYFNTLDNINASLLGPSGARYLSTPTGSFISTSDQTAAVINTAYAVTLSAVNGTVNNNVFIGGAAANTFPNSEIYVTYPGIYNLQFSLQLNNADTQEHDVNIWLRKNGNNEADTNTVVGVPQRHGGIDGHTVAAWNFFIEWDDVADYYELAWSTPDLDVKIDYKAAAAPAPATPSVILTLHYVSRL
jgi:hypothetical protein